jgi:heat shock protein HslJ
MKKFYISILLTLLIAVITASCDTFPEQVIDPLTNTTWKLSTYAGKNPLPGKNMTAAFDGEGISGSASCNHYFGSYQLKGDQITIFPLRTWYMGSATIPFFGPADSQRIYYLFSKLK